MSDLPEVHYSMLSKYFICPKKLFWEKQGIKGPLSSAIVYGCVFHKAMEYALTGQNFTVQVLMDNFLTNIDTGQHNWNGVVLYKNDDPMPNDMVSWIDEAVDLCLNHRKTKPQSTELRLSHTYPGLCTLAGRVDAIWDGGIVDFKLAGKYYKPDPLQAACYAILNGGPTKFEFIVIRKESAPRLEIIPIPQVRNRKYLDFIANEVIIPGAQVIFNGPWPANPSHPFCTRIFCSFWEVCIGRIS